jgi:hypothetical protein
MFDLWETKWQLDRLSPSTAVSPANYDTPVAPYSLIVQSSTLYKLDADSVVKK